MIPVERMSLARALDIAARIADPEDGADEVPQSDRREAVDVLRCEVVRRGRRFEALRAAVRELAAAEAAHLVAFDGEIASGEALPMTEASLRGLWERMRSGVERINAARADLDALTREP